MPPVRELDCKAVWLACVSPWPIRSTIIVKGGVQTTETGYSCLATKSCGSATSIPSKRWAGGLLGLHDEDSYYGLLLFP